VLATRHWNFPVMIACPRSGQVYTVATTADALKTLTTTWPVADGEAFVNAVEVCEDVTTGTATPEDARLAFLEAADEAKVVYELIALSTQSEPIQIVRRD
jgi:hypothetical protein